MDFTLAFVADKNILDTICISKLDLDSNCIFIIIVYLPSGEAATPEKKKKTQSGSSHMRLTFLGTFPGRWNIKLKAKLTVAPCGRMFHYTANVTDSLFFFSPFCGLSASPSLTHVYTDIYCGKEPSVWPWLNGCCVGNGCPTALCMVSITV